MKKTVLLCVALALVFSVVSGQTAGVEKELSWYPVGTYTDNTPIEATKQVLYNATMDNVPIAARTTNTWQKFTVLDHNTPHLFTVQTELSTGEKSAVSPPYPWTSPAGVPNLPSGGCTVGDPRH